MTVHGNQAWRRPLTTSRAALLDADGGDSGFRRLIYGILTVSANFDRIRERLAAALGLSGSQYHVLMAVAELEPEQRVTVSAVAERLRISGAYATTEIKKLERLGYVDKKPNPDDGRSVALETTAAARALIEAFAPSLRQVNDALFDGLAPEDFRGFRALVEHMRGTSAWAADLARHVADEHASRIRDGNRAAGAAGR